MIQLQLIFYPLKFELIRIFLTCFSLIGYIIGCLNRYTVLENPLDTPLYMYISGFYPSTFVYSRFFPKIEFFYCLHEDALPTHFSALKYKLFLADKQL